MAKTKRKATAANVPVPQNREDAASAIAEIGRLRREIDRRKADADDQVSRIKEAVETGIAPALARLAELEDGVHIWAEANKDALTGGGKRKHADLATGKVLWRLRPPSVRAKSGLKVEQLVERLEALGLSRFVRIKKELNKDAMLADPDTAAAVDGVKIGPAVEDFLIEPAEIEMDEVKG